MRASRSRWTWWIVAVFIVMLEAVIPQRVFAQWRAETIAGIRFGPPLRAGLALGVGFGNDMAAAQFGGPLALVEAAVGGGRASAGYLFAGPFASGIELLGSAIYTWGWPSQLQRNQTLAGGEMRVSVLLLNVGVGVFRPIGGFTNDTRARYYLNVGLGI